MGRSYNPPRFADPPKRAARPAGPAAPSPAAPHAVSSAEYAFAFAFAKVLDEEIERTRGEVAANEAFLEVLPLAYSRAASRLWQAPGLDTTARESARLLVLSGKRRALGVPTRDSTGVHMSRLDEREIAA